MHFKKFVAAEVPVEELKLFFSEIFMSIQYSTALGNNYYLNEPSSIVGR